MPRRLLSSLEPPERPSHAGTDARGVNRRRGLKVKVQQKWQLLHLLLWVLVLTLLLDLGLIVTRLHLPASLSDINVVGQVLKLSKSRAHANALVDLKQINPTTKIFAIGCNRPQGLLKTLTSVRKAVTEAEAVAGQAGPAEFGGKLSVPLNVSLNICIDGCGNEEVAAVARQFHWPHGEKHTLIRSAPGLGLAKHIVGCWPDPRPEEWALFLEDDVILSPHAFAAYREALVIRARQTVPGNIFGIALHDSRINQYCWKTHSRRVTCPRIHKQCKTKTAQESIFGNLQCDYDHELANTSANWMLRQVPSSWGAFYEGGAWAQFKDYWAKREETGLTPSQKLGLAVPLSMSNEWTNSWKRSLMELMFANGWTLMYRSQPDQLSFATTMRSQGVHTYNGSATSASTSKDSEARCLMDLPLDNRATFTVDWNLLSTSPMRLASLDYCDIEASVPELIAEGAVWKGSLRRNLHNYQNSSSLYSAVAAMDRADRDEVQYPSLPQLVVNQNHTKAHRVVAMNCADLVLVTSIGTFDSTFASMLRALDALGGGVKLIVAAPAKVCPRLRGYANSMCLDETEYVNPRGGNQMPVITMLLQAALDVAQPNAASWVGVVNADLVFDKSLIETLSLLNETSKCLNEACVITGRRIDVDHATHTETMHSFYGMDYFVFNRAGIDLALSLKLPPLTIGRVRWDSWFMGYFCFLEGINTIDASSSIRVLHYMDTKDSYLSKRVQDVTNLKLADVFYRLGRTTWANYRITEDSALVPQVSTNEIQAKYHSNIFRYVFDRQLEEATEFTYTIAGVLQAKYGCFCELLDLFFPSRVQAFSVGISCTTSEYFNKSHAVALEHRVIFKKGVFERLAGMASDSLVLATVQGLATRPEQASKCCVFRQSTASVEMPEMISTTEDAGSDSFVCTQSH